jgi:hypothetical protein
MSLCRSLRSLFRQLLSCQLTSEFRVVSLPRNKQSLVVKMFSISSDDLRRSAVLRSQLHNAIPAYLEN